MTNPEIPEEAVKAAAWAIQECPRAHMTWEPEARAAIAAALPHLRVQETPEDGLREAANDLRAWCDMQREASGLEETEFAAGEFLAYKRVIVHLRKMLADHPAPHPRPVVDREALAIALHDSVCPDRRCEPTVMGRYFTQADAVLALLTKG